MIDPSLRRLAAAALLLAAFSLQGCSKAREAFGLERQAPDEFAVVARAPLTLPPDYGLRPPEPGTRRPQETSVPQAARSTVLGSGGRELAPGAPPRGLTRGEDALLASAGAMNPSPDIRARVDEESAALAAARIDFIEWLMFWRDAPPPGVVVDAQKEARRIQETIALGEPAVKGRTPVIERRESGFLERVFN